MVISAWVAEGLAGGCAALALVFSRRPARRTDEWWVGFLTFVSAVALLVATVLVVCTVDVWLLWGWLGAGLVVAVALARDWSRSWFVGAAVVLLLSGVLLLGRHGYAEETSRAAYERALILQQLFADTEAAERAASSAPLSSDKAVSAARDDVLTAIKGVAGQPGLAPLQAAAQTIVDAVGADKPLPIDAYVAVKRTPVVAASGAGLDLVNAVDALHAAVVTHTLTAESSTGVLTAISRAEALVEDGGPAWESAQRSVVLALAQFRDRTAGTDVTAAAVASAQQSYDEPVTSTPGTSWQDAVGSGPAAVFAATFGGQVLIDPRCGLADHICPPSDGLTAWLAGAGRVQGLTADALGWAVCGVLILLLWTGLLTLNAREQAGPVSVPDVDSTDDLRSSVRLAVLTNISEPGAAPGSQSTNPVADLLELAGISTGPVNAFLTKLVGITGRARGYVVSYEPLPKDAGSDKTDDAATDATSAKDATPAAVAPVSTLFQVRSVMSNQLVGTRNATSADAKTLGRIGGLWAAGVILGRSTRIPSWATWSPGTAAAIGGDAADLDGLLTALQAAPRSGLLLTKAGAALELAGRVPEAIELYARAVAAHPGYLIARYRLAVAIGSMRHATVNAQAIPASLDFSGPLWVEKVITDRPLLDQLFGPDREKVEKASTTLAERLFADLAHDLRLRLLIAGAFHRSERTYVLQLLTSGSAGRFRSMVTIAHAGYVEQRAVDEQVGRMTRRSYDWWQSWYNLACAQAQTGAVDAAMTTLVGCLDRRGVQQLTAAWATTDADLTEVSKANPTAWAHFIAQLKES